MIARGLQADIGANNLANSQTTGFKKDRVNFRELIDHRLLLDRGRGAPSPENRLREGFETRFTQGPIKRTDAPLDFALEGPGFFAVLDEEGQERYARAGHFLLDESGSLVTPDGHAVLGEAGALQLGPGPVELNGDGLLVQNGQELGRLKLVEFDDPQRLAKLGRNLFTPVDEETIPRAAEQTRALQGSLESSNAAVVELMVEMIEHEKMYTFAQRALQLQDDNLGRAVAEIGRVTG